MAAGKWRRSVQGGAVRREARWVRAGLKWRGSYIRWLVSGRVWGCRPAGRCAGSAAHKVTIRGLLVSAGPAALGSILVCGCHRRPRSSAAPARPLWSPSLYFYGVLSLFQRERERERERVRDTIDLSPSPLSLSPSLPLFLSPPSLPLSPLSLSLSQVRRARIQGGEGVVNDELAKRGGDCSS